MSDEPKRFDSVIEMLTHDCHKYALENARLKAEVERLRKAGDAMAVMVGHIEITGDAHRMMLELSKDWDDAKEGKQP